MTSNDLQNVLVLGARGEIGSAICDKFVREGHAVVRVSRADFDLTNSGSIDAWFAGERGRVGVLVHAAGFNIPAPFAELTDSEIETCFESNVSGFLRVMRHLTNDLVDERGRVVVLSSLFGFMARHGRLPYTMSKHALVGVVKSLAIELGSFGVLVNAISPGYIDTELTRRNNDSRTLELLANRIPLGRLGDVGTIAEATYFLCSRHNEYITGSDLVIDGGFSINGGL